MRNTPRRKGFSYTVKERLRLFIIIGITMLLGIGTVNEMRRKYELNEELGKLVKRGDEVQARTEQMKKEAQALKNPDYIELEARKQLNLMKPGEQVIFFTEKSTSSSPERLPEEDKSESAATRSNLRQWWDYFFVRE